jgi:hypothetical protein
MASIPELLDGHVPLEVECLNRLYLNGYIGPPGNLGRVHHTRKDFQISSASGICRESE